MQVNSVNNVSNQNFGALRIGTQARAYIKEQAMNPRNKQAWHPFVEGLKAAQTALKDQKWGDVLVTLKEGITTHGTDNFNIATALCAPMLVGRCIENHWVTKTEFNTDNAIVREEMGSPLGNSKETTPTETWGSIQDAVAVAEKHERYAQDKNEKVLMQQKRDDEYCDEMKNSLKELGIE